MVELAVGIPSLNEAENIGSLTHQVDQAAQILGIQVCIINADNCSDDGTATVFQKTETANPKISILTEGRGKGRNVISILEQMVAVDEIGYCFLVDADITSFDQKWLEAHYDQYKKGADFVLPRYRRRYVEGNATNHFSYPLMRFLLDGPAPRQPIAGDVGLSRRLGQYILGRDMHSSTYGYGIDMFMSMSALSFDGTIAEVPLDVKLHSPSFPKMTQIFQEEAAAYYFARQNQTEVRANFNGSAENGGFLDAEPISEADLDKRLEEAVGLQNNSAGFLQQGARYFENNFISVEEWAQVLAWHEKNIDKYSADALAQSITPYYLLRAVSYLKTVRSPDQAEALIESQAEVIARTLKPSEHI